MWIWRRHLRLRRVALGLAVAAIVAPTAQARIANEYDTRSQPAVQMGDYSGIEQARLQPRGTSGPQLVSAPSFDWGDAGVGAGLAFAAMLLAGVTSLALRQNRRLAEM
jgi:hypothetical protein